MKIDRRMLLRMLPTAAFGTFGILRTAPLQKPITVNDQLGESARNAPLSMQFRGTTAADCAIWQRSFARTLRTLLGPHRPPAEWETAKERTVTLADHYRDELLLKADGHPVLPLYLLRPKGDPGVRRPAVVAVHGHGVKGHDGVAGVEETPGVLEAIQDVNCDYGRQLARRGYLVAIPCLVPFGRRLDEPEAYQGDDVCAVTFVRMQLLGKVLMAENLRDVLWAFELLHRHEQVDSNRIGCVGLSYGGRLTMLAAALEQRIRVAVCSGALNVMQERIMLRYSCGAQVIPGLLEFGDVPEIASLIAPRPCLWEVGNRDGLISPEWADRALSRIRNAYRAYGTDENLLVYRFDGAHQWNGEQAYPLLDRVLAAAI